MGKTLFTISRLIVGALFVFSGFVKAVDPTGYAIKITDYFDAFGMSWLTPTAYFFSIAISSLEFLTGIHLVLGQRVKFFGIIATIFMAIFTPLTFYLAVANPVTDCGCFGDAVKLTNWETFFKNTVLLLPTLYIFFSKKKYESKLSSTKKLISTALALIFIVWISVDALRHLPEIDFRPYKVGANINEGMSIPEGAEQAVYETTFILKKDGVEKSFTAENYPYTDTTWVLVDTKTETVKEGYVPPIHDFYLTDEEGNDFTQTLLNDSRQSLLVVSPSMKDANWEESFNKLDQMHKYCIQNDINFYVLTSSSNEDITTFEFANDAGFTYLQADETVLKTIIRSNPGLVLIQNGNILGKWHYNDIPKVEEFKNPVSYSITQLGKAQNKTWLKLLFVAFFLFVSLLCSGPKEKQF